MTTHTPQGAYETAPALGYPGLIASANVADAFTYRAEATDMGFGLALSQGTGDRDAVLGGADFIGVSIADKSVPLLADGSAGYGMGASLAALRKGLIWVTAATAVSPADGVTCAGDGTIGAGLATAIPGARFDGTAAAGALVRLYLG